MIPLIGGIGWQEVLVVAAVIFVLFGASRLPAAFRSLGEGLRSFKEGISGTSESTSAITSGGGDEAPPAATSDGGGASSKQA